jgi:hypothetical protein
MAASMWTPTPARLGDVPLRRISWLASRLLAAALGVLVTPSAAWADVTRDRVERAGLDDAALTSRGLAVARRLGDTGGVADLDVERGMARPPALVIGLARARRAPLRGVADHHADRTSSASGDLPFRAVLDRRGIQAHGARPTAPLTCGLRSRLATADQGDGDRESLHALDDDRLCRTHANPSVAAVGNFRRIGRFYRDGLEGRRDTWAPHE